MPDDMLNPVVGIDLGASFSSIARWAGDRSVVYGLADGNLTLPSCVYMQESGVPLVGKYARQRGMTDPPNAFKNITRHLGNDDTLIRLRGMEYTPVDISAMIMQRLVQDVSRKFPSTAGFELSGAVVTHPYCFAHPQIVRLRQAVEKAGIPVIRLVPAPVAVALDYCFATYRGSDQDAEEKILVFDFGGGKLDVAVIQIVNGRDALTLSVLHVGGDDSLGGTDIDCELADWALQEAGIHLESVEDESVRNRAAERLFEGIIGVKCGLSAMDTDFLTIPNLLPDTHLELEITRDQFNNILVPRYDRIRQLISSAIASAQLRVGELDRTIMVGGSSRISMVHDIVREETGVECWANADPDLAVCRGAAFLAAIYDARLEFAKKFNLELRAPYSTGIQREDGQFFAGLPANRDLPYSFTSILNREDVIKRSHQIEVFQSKYPNKKASHDGLVKAGVVRLSASPPDDETCVRLTVSMDVEQLLRYTAEWSGQKFEGPLSLPGGIDLDHEVNGRDTHNRALPEVLESLKKACQFLPELASQALNHVYRKLSDRQSLRVADAEKVYSELTEYARDCLLAGYLRCGRHDVLLLGYLLQEQTELGTPDCSVLERLSYLSDQTYIPRLPDSLVHLTQLLIGDTQPKVGIEDASRTSRSEKMASLGETEFARLSRVISEVAAVASGQELFVGYGDSVYRIQSPSPVKVDSIEGHPLRHGECLLRIVDSGVWLPLTPFWEVCAGPSLRRRPISGALPYHRSWDLGNTRLILIAAPLQNLIVDAIMISNDSRLRMNTLTSSSVALAAGKELRQYTQGKQVEYGDIFVTPAGALSVKEIYHACTIGGERPLSADDLSALIVRVLTMAAAAGHSSLALPLLGRNYGLDVIEISGSYLRAIREYGQSSSVLKNVVLSTPYQDDPVAHAIEGELSAGSKNADIVNRALVFISANHADYEYATRVYRFLISRSLTVFFSEESLPELGSSDYRREIDQALDKAEHMIVVTSSTKNVNSSWVEAEWGFFINEKRSGRKPGNLVTVTVDGLNPSELPPSLRYYEVIPYNPEKMEKILRYVSGQLQSND